MIESAVFLDEFYSRKPRPGLFIQPLNYDPAYDAKFVYQWFTTDRLGEPFVGFACADAWEEPHYGWQTYTRHEESRQRLRPGIQRRCDGQPLRRPQGVRCASLADKA